MKDQNERIVCASIHFDDGKQYSHQPKNIINGICVNGLRHANCFAMAVVLFGMMGERSKKGIIETQGFLTNKNRFVDRTEAGKIALACGQIEKLSYYNGQELDSSDLY